MAIAQLSASDCIWFSCVPLNTMPDETSVRRFNIAFNTTAIMCAFNGIHEHPVTIDLTPTLPRSGDDGEVCHV